MGTGVGIDTVQWTGIRMRRGTIIVMGISTGIGMVIGTEVEYGNHEKKTRTGMVMGKGVRTVMTIGMGLRMKLDYA